MFEMYDSLAMALMIKAALLETGYFSEEKYAEKSSTDQETIEILKSFALVNNNGLWMDSIKIEQNTINVTIRAFDAQVIEKYIYEVAKITNLKLITMLTKNLNYKEVVNNKTEDNSKPLPFSVKLYLDSIKNNVSDNKQSENEENKDYIKKNKIFFTYEAQITLLAHAK